jgi:hypothetical protein
MGILRLSQVDGYRKLIDFRNAIGDAGLVHLQGLDQLIDFDPNHKILPKLQSGALLLNEALGLLVKPLECFWWK